MLHDDAFDAQVRALTAAILHGAGQLDAVRRREAFHGSASDPELAAFVAKVARHAYTVRDEDITRLRRAGFSEDQIFEATICAAVGAGLSLLDAGLRALEEA